MAISRARAVVRVSIRFATFARSNQQQHADRRRSASSGVRTSPRPIRQRLDRQDDPLIRRGIRACELLTEGSGSARACESPTSVRRRRAA